MGELRPWPQVSVSGVEALLYLIVFGSIIGSTAFVWLSATVVSSHAYINPVVTVTVGYFFAGEAVVWRTLRGGGDRAGERGGGAAAAGGEGAG